VDAIGGSSAGIIVDNEIRVASLLRAVPPKDFPQAAGIFKRLQREWNVPVVVMNDGDVTALAGALTKAGFQARKPKGSFFLYVKAPKAAVSKTGARIEFRSAEEVSQWLITEKLISTVPWDDVGAYLRFSVTFAAPTVADEGRIVGAIAERLSDVRFEF